jgi:hypothetical protein
MKMRVQDIWRYPVKSMAGFVMTTFDPETLAHSPEVLHDVVKRFGGKLVLNCDGVQGEVVRVAQEVELLPAIETLHAR